MQQTSQVASRVWPRVGLTCVLALFILRAAWDLPDERAWGQAPAEAKADDPIGQFVTLQTTVTGKEFARVARVAKSLQSRAREQQRKGILVLEIADGPSRFGDVRELAIFLSSELADVRTVAYIPKDVRGFNVIAALACDEIVLGPRAGLGDIGRGQAAEDDVRTFVDSLVAKRHNPLVSSALVQGMMDPAAEVIWVRRQVGQGRDAVTETEILTPQAFQRLVDGKVVIEDQRAIKNAGAVGLFTGNQARAGNYLCSHVVEERHELAKLYRLPNEALREDPTQGGDVVARRIRIEGVITPLTQEFNQRQVERVLAEGANLIIFEIESPGGYLTPSVQLASLIAELPADQVRTVAYVPEAAHSGAAIIALGCDQIIMHPDARIGDAGPIEIKEGGAFERADEKILSDLRAVLQILADKKHRPAGLCMAMADRNLAVYRATNKQTGEIGFKTEAELHDSAEEWVKGPRVDESGNGNLLTVSGKRAYELKLAEEPVASFEELKQRLGIPAEESLPPIGPTWVDSLVFLLNTPAMTGVLFVLGILCIYAEMHIPMGLFLIGAVVCFALFFWSRVLGGTAGWLEVILFLIGSGCIAIEVFVVPGVGIFIISGGLMILTSLVMASQTFIIPATRGDYKQLATELQTLGGSLAGVIIGGVFLSRLLPRMKFFDRFVLVPPGATLAVRDNEPQLRPDLASMESSHLEPFAWLVNQRGRTVTVLRPSGKAQFSDQLVDVVSEGPFIDPGSPVQVIEVSGNRVVVRQIS